MLVIYEESLFVTVTEKGKALTTAFYDLSLADKFGFIEQLAREGKLMSDYSFYEKLIKGCLQHSSKEMKSSYPVRGERKVRPAAKEADKIEALQAYTIYLEDLIAEHPEEIFKLLVKGLTSE
jgi:hypothetical protein